MLKTLSGYQLNLRAAAYGLWSGRMDYYAAFDQMFGAIDRGIPQAWAEGAKECGIQPDEYSPEEQQALAQAIASEKNYVDEFLTWIEEHSQANGGKRDAIYSRLDIWVNRYRDIINRAKAMACADQKFMWVLGPTEHCKSCAKLAGRVKRGSFWQEHVMPQNPPNGQLECGGWKCQCGLEPTDAPVSRGPLPSLP